MRGLPLFLLLCACAPEDSVQGRPYEVRAPKDASGPLPMLILAHGYGANGWAQDVVFPFSKEVEGRRFLEVLPNGTLNSLGHRYWNATEACCGLEDEPAVAPTVDDVAFFRALVDDVKAHHDVAEGKVFIVGHSNGAFMSLRLACDAPDLFNGIVAVSGSTWVDAARCAPGRTAPLLLVHGTEDDTIPYAGKDGAYPGALETAARFGRRAHCTGALESVARADFLGDADAETNQQRTAGCPDGAEVDLWTMGGIGHVPVFDSRWTGATLDWLLEHAR